MGNEMVGAGSASGGASLQELLLQAALRYALGDKDKSVMLSNQMNGVGSSPYIQRRASEMPKEYRDQFVQEANSYNYPRSEQDLGVMRYSQGSKIHALNREGPLRDFDRQELEDLTRFKQNAYPQSIMMDPFGATMLKSRYGK
jgi:hypothetical protein